MTRATDTPRGWPGLARLMFVLVLLLVGCANPGTALPPAERTPSALSEGDRRFVLEAAGAGLYRLEAARLAELRATDPMLKAYAALLVRQNTTANDELRTMAQLRGVVWLGAPPAVRREGLNRALAGLAGEAFDRRFVEQVGIADHQIDLLFFETAVRSIEDTALRDWAEKMIKTLHRHLATARALPLVQQPQA